MIHETYQISVPGSLPDTKLITYIQGDFQDVAISARPLVLVCPGGGYVGTCDREGEPLAMQFLAMGYHAAVLKYSCAPAVFPTALAELACSVRLIREHAQEWHVEPRKIIVLGCSAGGHLAASLGVFWKRDFLAQFLGAEDCDRSVFRPDGMILCYPVITSGEFAHRGSFENLLGEQEEALNEKLGMPPWNWCLWNVRWMPKRPLLFSGILIRTMPCRWRILCFSSVRCGVREYRRNFICIP